MRIRGGLAPRAAWSGRSHGCWQTQEEKPTPKAVSRPAVGILESRGAAEQSQTVVRWARTLVPAGGSPASVSSSVPGDKTPHRRGCWKRQAEPAECLLCEHMRASPHRLAERAEARTISPLQGRLHRPLPRPAKCPSSQWACPVPKPPLLPVNPMKGRAMPATRPGRRSRGSIPMPPAPQHGHCIPAKA